jgi:hypothetical protein
MTIRGCETAGTRLRAWRSAWVRPKLPTLAHKVTISQLSRLLAAGHR